MEAGALSQLEAVALPRAEHPAHDEPRPAVRTESRLARKRGRKVQGGRSGRRGQQLKKKYHTKRGLWGNGQYKYIFLEKDIWTLNWINAIIEFFQMGVPYFTFFFFFGLHVYRCLNETETSRDPCPAESEVVGFYYECWEHYATTEPLSSFIFV